MQSLVFGGSLYPKARYKGAATEYKYQVCEEGRREDPGELCYFGSKASMKDASPLHGGFFLHLSRASA